MNITGLEANLLLFCLDAYCEVDAGGKLNKAQHGYTLRELQDLRDRLFLAHEHPKEDNEEERFVWVF